MKPIGLIEFRFHRHTFEKKRIERQMMDARKISRRFAASGRVLGLIKQGRAIVAAMTNNLWFPNPTPALPAGS